MRKSTRKGGALEDSLMRVASLRSELERVMSTMLPDNIREKLERFVGGAHGDIGDIAETNMAKTVLEPKTKRLLIDLLNGMDKSIPGMYKSSMDPARGTDDVGITPAAQHFHSLVKEWSPRPVRISSANQGGSVNIGNTFVMVEVLAGKTVPAQVLWLFRKRIARGTGRDDGAEVYFAHIRRIETVEPAVALGENHPCLELMVEAGLLFALPGDDDGRELVVPFAHIKSQMSVTPFRSAKGSFRGLKAV